MNYSNLRHSCAHLLAAAVMKLWPSAKPAIGPAIENGFYYDFEFEHQISSSDLSKIEDVMKKILPSWTSFTKHYLTSEEAKKKYQNNPYKQELIDQFSEHGKKKVSFYKSGSYWDLCKGGHIDKPNEALKHFKLLSIAGAYWKGDETNKMLTRIYGTCFPTKEELDAYLLQLEEAKKRDHKKVGKELDLFFFSHLVGPGLPLWTPKGTLLRNLLDSYVWELRQQKGYQKVTIPHITKKELYETSGHWSKFSQELFRITTRENHEFAMKPMNCPHHIQIYNHISRSYKDLPQRYAETTMVYRDEQTGELSGLSRVRSVTQDDAHVFCRYSQLDQEIQSIWEIIETFYMSFGFHLSVRLSMHDPKNMKAYLGNEKTWKEAEKKLITIAKVLQKTYTIAEGEAAFYGPKIDFIAQDSLNRSWQVATIQLDLNMPERFNLTCVNEKGEHERIAMVHAAIMGSIERFTSILIEHTGGKFPLWLQPIQISLIPVRESHDHFALTISNVLQKYNLRVSIEQSANGSIGKKVRSTVLQRIPYVIIIGDKEMKQSKIHPNNPLKWKIHVRNNYSSTQKEYLVGDFLNFLQELIQTKSLLYV